MSPAGGATQRRSVWSPPERAPSKDGARFGSLSAEPSPVRSDVCQIHELPSLSGSGALASTARRVRSSRKRT